MSEYYRLLNEGEKILKGDEFLGDSGWKQSPHVGCEFTERVFKIHRRKITLPEWRPISDERLRTYYNVLAINESRELAIVFPVDGRLRSFLWTHWMPLPDPPKPEKSAEEIAFEKHFTELASRFDNGGMESAHRRTWLACLEFAKGK